MQGQRAALVVTGEQRHRVGKGGGGGVEEGVKGGAAAGAGDGAQGDAEGDGGGDDVGVGDVQVGQLQDLQAQGVSGRCKGLESRGKSFSHALKGRQGWRCACVLIQGLSGSAEGCTSGDAVETIGGLSYCFARQVGLLRWCGSCRSGMQMSQVHHMCAVCDSLADTHMGVQ